MVAGQSGGRDRPVKKPRRVGRGHNPSRLDSIRLDYATDTESYCDVRPLLHGASQRISLDLLEESIRRDIELIGSDIRSAVDGVSNVDNPSCSVSG